MRTLLAATAFLISGAALAQSTDTPSASTPPAPAANTAPANSAPALPPTQGKPATLGNELRPTFVTQTPDEMVSSKLVGLSIQNRADETIGAISDMVLDESMRVKAWVVAVGGFLGIGTKYVAVDPSALKLDRTDAKNLKAVIDTNKDQLRAAPEYIYLGKEKPAEKPATNDGQGGAPKAN